MNTFALPIALAALNVGVLISAPAKAAEYDAKVGGIITGEVLCSLYRAGVSPEVGAAEARRVTLRLLEKGLITEADADTYRRTVQGVFNMCPEPALPDA